MAKPRPARFGWKDDEFKVTTGDGRVIMDGTGAPPKDEDADARDVLVDVLTKEEQEGLDKTKKED